MKGLKFCALVLSAGMLLSSCGGNMNNTGKGVADRCRRRCSLGYINWNLGIQQ